MRKHAIATTMAVIAAMAFGASTASALEIVARDGITEQLCPAVQISGNTVTGGCLVEDMEGSYNIQTENWFYSTCGDSSMDLRIGPDARAVAVNQQVNCVPLGRQACRDDSTGEVKPWTTGTWRTTLNWCLEQVSNGSDQVYPVNFQYTFSSPSGGYLYSITQTSTPNGIGGAHFTNTGSTFEVSIAAE